MPLLRYIILYIVLGNKLLRQLGNLFYLYYYSIMEKSLRRQYNFVLHLYKRNSKDKRFEIHNDLEYSDWLSGLI